MVSIIKGHLHDQYLNSYIEFEFLYLIVDKLG